jgi:hypothetical protein
MKRTKITIAIIAVLALTVLAGEALAGAEGRGRGGPAWGRGPGRGNGPGWGRGMVAGPQTGANLEPVQSDNYWRPGPYCPYAQGPNQNIRGRRGPGRGGFGQSYQRPTGPYYPYGQGLSQNIQGWQGRGPGLRGQGLGRWDLTVQRGPMTGRGGRGPAMMGRDGRGFQRGYLAPKGWGMNNWQGESSPGFYRQGPGMRQQWFTPDDTDQTNRPAPPTGRGREPGWGPGWRQGANIRPRWFAPDDTDKTNQSQPPRGRGWEPDWRPGWRQGWEENWTPDREPDLKSDKTPDTNAPDDPVAKDHPEEQQEE